MKKGISPLVAAVILIAATMSIAGIISFWASSFVTRELSGAENVTAETICTAAKFRLYSGTYDPSSKELVVILENQRLQEIKLDRLYLFYSPNSLRSIGVNGTLAGNELKSFNISGVDDGFENAELRSTCPDVAVSFNYNDVT